MQAEQARCEHLPHGQLPTASGPASAFLPGPPSVRDLGDQETNTSPPKLLLVVVFDGNNPKA